MEGEYSRAGGERRDGCQSTASKEVVAGRVVVAYMHMLQHAVFVLHATPYACMPWPVMFLLFIPPIQTAQNCIFYLSACCLSSSCLPTMYISHTNR